MLYRQGDVLLRKIDAIPPDATKDTTAKGHCVLAEGEATGHSHTITSRRMSVFRRGSDGLFLSLGQRASVKHQEHDAIDLPAGDYEVIRQREYTPAGIVRVAD